MERLFENLGSMKWPKLPGTFPLAPKRGIAAPHMNPSCKGQRANARCVMAYGHKTQSFMKKGGHQKGLDKAL